MRSLDNLYKILGTNFMGYECLFFYWTSNWIMIDEISNNVTKGNKVKSLLVWENDSFYLSLIKPVELLRMINFLLINRNTTEFPKFKPNTL